MLGFPDVKLFQRGMHPNTIATAIPRTGINIATRK